MEQTDSYSENYYPASSSTFTPPSSFDPKPIIRVVSLRVKWMPFILLGFLLTGILAYFVLPRNYESLTIIKSSHSMSGGGSSGNLLDGNISVAYPGASDPSGNFMAIALSENVLQRVIDILKPNSSMPDFKGMPNWKIRQKLKKMITITAIADSDLYTFKARSQTPQFAADLANTWALANLQENLDLTHKQADAQNRFLKEQADEYEKRIKNPNRGLNDRSKSDDTVYRLLQNQIEVTEINKNVDDAGMIVMTPAAVPTAPVSPKITLTVPLFLLIGFVVCIGYAFAVELIEKQVNDDASLEKASGLSNYAYAFDFKDELDKTFSDFKNPPSKDSLISNPRFNGSRYCESFRIMAARLTSIRNERPLQTIGLFSSNAKDGRTLVSANLAISIARSGRKVLLVDADFKNPSIAKLFEVSNEQGGLQKLLEGAEISTVTLDSGIPNLWLLPSPPNESGPTAPLASTTLMLAMDKMRKEFDVIIFDTAPLLPVTDPLTLSTVLDGVMFVSRWNSTKTLDVFKSLRYLHSVDAPMIGTILNGIQMNKGLPTWTRPNLGRWLWDV